MKEQIEATANQKEEKIFTSKIIDSQMGKKLGVTDTGVENQKIEGTKYIQPKPDMVEQYNLVGKLSCVKNLFKTFREKSLEAMKNSIRYYTELVEAADQAWADKNYVSVFCPDHGAHDAKPGKGTHGSDQASDAIVNYFYRLRYCSNNPQ